MGEGGGGGDGGVDHLHGGAAADRWLGGAGAWVEDSGPSRADDGDASAACGCGGGASAGGDGDGFGCSVGARREGVAGHAIGERRGADGYHGGTVLMFASLSSDSIRKSRL